jgi:hypothetical protein
MAFERWGSLSVVDHIDTAALVANVLLYDRLVIPVMTDQPDRNEREYWISHGWDPDLQVQRLNQLEELAIRRPWNQTRRNIFKTRAEELAAEQFDADHLGGYGLTRMILAQEQVTEKLPGVQHVQVIAAYNSTKSVKQDFHLTDLQDQLAAQAFLLTRRLAVPDLPNVEEALNLAIELSRDAEFRAKRTALFDWQELTALKGIPPEAVVEHIAEMTDSYNAQIKTACAKVYWRLAFTVFGIGLGFATGGILAATATAALSLVQFAMFDSKPVIEAESTRPAAMFHDVKERVGLKLTSTD